MVLDLFSRFVVPWMVSRKENSALAKQLIHEASAPYDIALGQLTLHQDRGAPMIARGYLDLMAELEITCSHSRPRVSKRERVEHLVSHSEFVLAFTTWLDLSQAAQQAEAIAPALARKRPDGKEQIERNLQSLREDLLALDERVTEITRTDPGRHSSARTRHKQPCA